MLGGEVQIHSATGIRVCSGIDKNGTFCLVDSEDAYPCRGLFRHVRVCNDDYNRPALNPFICGAKCGDAWRRWGPGVGDGRRRGGLGLGGFNPLHRAAIWRTPLDSV